MNDRAVAFLETDEANPCGTLGSVSGHQLLDGGLVVECGEASVVVGVERGGIIRVRLAPKGTFGREHSWAVVPYAGAATAWRHRIDDGTIVVLTDHSGVQIERDPCRISFSTPDDMGLAADHATKGMAWDDEEVRCWKRLREGDHVFGLGERGCPLDKRGGVLVNWNHDAAEHDPWTDPLYQSHPFFLVLNSGRAHGIFFDNTHRATFDFGKTAPDRYSFGAVGGEMDYYFIPGPDPMDVIRRYALLVGTTPLPPRWALGYQQCRWSYHSAGRVREVARRLRTNRIPCDTIYLDIDYMDGFRCFTWDSKRFGRPKRLMTELSKLGFKCVCIVDPGIKKEAGYAVYDAGVAGDHFCRDEHGNHYVGKVWPGETVYPDFTRASTREWWGALYNGLVDDGVTGFWNDMNEPADFTFSHGTVPLNLRHDNDGEPADHGACHNIYGMQMARATFEGLRRIRPDERPFVLTRAGYAGVQRYAAAWTGENLSSWEHLRMSIPMLLNMSLSGVAFCGADVGGFRSYPSPELYTRWLQLGLFYPLFRTHTAGGKEQDPTAFGKKHLAINRRAIELRYELLPYIYTQMREAEQSGVPLLRPLLLDFPEHRNVHRCEHSFMFGDRLLVAPVVQEGATHRKVHLPEGEWFGFFDRKRYEGGREYEIPVTLESIPMFARAGAVIPMQRVVQYSGERPLERLILLVFPGEGEGSFYNDDGSSYDYRAGGYTIERYSTTRSRGTCELRLIQRDGSNGFAPSSYEVRFVNTTGVASAEDTEFGVLPARRTRREFERSSRGWWGDRQSQTVCVRTGSWRPGAGIKVKLGSKSRRT